MKLFFFQPFLMLFISISTSNVMASLQTKMEDAFLSDFIEKLVNFLVQQPACERTV